MTDDPKNATPTRRSRRSRLARKAIDSDTAAPRPTDAARPQPAAGPKTVLASTRPAFGYLPDDRLDALADRAFDLVERHGVVVNHDGAIQSLAKAGAKVDADGRRVRLPRTLVEEALAATPKQTTLAAKAPEYSVGLPRTDGTFTMRTGTGAHGWVDPETGRYRKLALEDVRTIAAVGDGLPEIGFIAHPFVNDVPERTADIHGLAALLGASEKHNWIQPYDADNVEYLMRLAAVAAGGEEALRRAPLVSCIACSFTPLEFKRMDVEAIIQSGRFGVPIHACALPTAGGTAPITMPATVLMAAAEILAMAVLAHVLAPGTPVIATPLIFALDVRTGRSLQSSVEALTGASMAIQLIKRRFGLLAHSYGAGSDTADADAQSQAERAMLCQSVALSGADILGGVGQLECATVFSPVQAVIDNELGAMMRAYLATPSIDDETTAWEDLLAVAPGGNFLATEHTLAHCREALVPGAFQRLGRDAYENSGRRDALAAARDIVRALIERDPPSGLPDADAVKEMASIVAAADRHILD